jgi:undecaprenyl-diphosphatase
MDSVQALIIAIVQGATELFPVSSLGHAVILPAVLNWNLDQRSASFLPFLVMLHVGTAVALLGFFWRDWLALVLGVLGLSNAHANKESRRVFVLLVIATIPAVIIGFLLEHYVRSLFASAVIASVFLTINGGVLLFGESLRARAGTRSLASLTPVDALIIGFWQCLALLPGISRSGSTIVGGLLRGINHEDSAHFSFLIAIPVILGATALEVPKLLHADIPSGTMALSVLCAVVAGITALLSTMFLMRYFRHNDKWALQPFAYYCIVAGALSFVYLEVR